MKKKHTDIITKKQNYPKTASSTEALFFYLYFTVISVMLSAAFAEKSN
ncbi:MAG TPA: hypothetical protein PLA12_06165 [Candidatus Hydrogenedens sp.]|nr:hypothetical protein [Candidatus Hydrogenedens sp.]